MSSYKYKIDDRVLFNYCYNFHGGGKVVHRVTYFDNSLMYYIMLANQLMINCARNTPSKAGGHDKFDVLLVHEREVLGYASRAFSDVDYPTYELTTGASPVFDDSDRKIQLDL